MSLLDLVPDISLPECEIIYNIGEALLFDDRGDIGFFTYRHRNNHYYNGKKSPNHPSPLHHWQIGALLVIFSEIAGLAAIAREVENNKQQDISYNSESYNNYI